MTVPVEAWEAFREKVRDTYTESELVLMPLRELKMVMREHGIGGVGAARVEVQWKVLQKTHVACHERDRKVGAEKMKVKEKLASQRVSSEIYTFQRQLGEKLWEERADKYREEELQLVQRQYEHLQEVRVTQDRVGSPVEQHLLDVRNDLWQQGFDQDVRAHAASAPPRPSTGILTPARRPAQCRDGTPPRFEVPVSPLKPCLSRKPRLATDGGFLSKSDPNNCVKSPHHNPPPSGIRVLSPTRWGETTSEPRAHRTNIKHIPDRLTRTANPCDMSTEEPTIPRKGNPSSANPNESSTPEMAKGSRRVFGRKNESNLQRSNVDIYARETPAQNQDVEDRRATRRGLLQEDTAHVERDGYIAIPKKGALRSASTPAGANPNYTETPEGTGAGGKSKVQQAQHDHGVMPPWVGPAESIPQAHPNKHLDEGVMPWNNDTKLSPQRRLKARSSQQQQQQAVQRSTSTGRRRAAPRSDCGVMPGAFGWGA